MLSKWISEMSYNIIVDKINSNAQGEISVSKSYKQ